MGGLEDTRAQISRELRYQSSLDLDEATYAAIRHLPLAQDLVRASRQHLVHRLDTYSKRHHKIFMEVRSTLTVWFHHSEHEDSKLAGILKHSVE